MAEQGMCQQEGCPYHAKYRIHRIDGKAIMIGPTGDVPRYCKRHGLDALRAAGVESVK